MHTCQMVWELRQLAMEGHVGQLEPMIKWWYYFNCYGIGWPLIF